MKPWKAIVLADLHCGNPRLDSAHFIGVMEEYVFPRITQDLTYVFIAGDFFDLLVNMNSASSLAALTVISRLKRLCYENKVRLRVLRGTYTHDRNQPRHFAVVAPEYNEFVSVCDTMCVEYDDETETSILYIPDDLKLSNIYDETEKLLEHHGLKQVDLVIHHGYFKHMLPPGIPEPNGTLDYDKFKKFYKGCVFNGHVHTPSIHQNVISVGSLDRFAYGEEEAKGFYIISRDAEGRYTYEFVENKHAYPFWTINLKAFNEDSMRNAVDYVRSAWYPKIQTAIDKRLAVHVRLVADTPGLIDGVAQVLHEVFPNIVVDKGASTKKEQYIENIAMDLSELPIITPDNVTDLAIPIIKKQHPDASDEEIRRVIEECKVK